MFDIVKKVEEMEYIDESIFIEWRDELEDFFYPLSLDDIGRLDNSAYDYLISLNKNNEKLLSEEIDILLEYDDAYFMEIIISRDKPLTSIHYWQYPKGSKGQILNISEKEFLEEHKKVGEKFILFAKKNNLTLLKDEELRKLVPYNGGMVSIYYKYFDDEYESITEIPY